MCTIQVASETESASGIALGDTITPNTMASSDRTLHYNHLAFIIIRPLHLKTAPKGGGKALQNIFKNVQKYSAHYYHYHYYYYY